MKRRGLLVLWLSACGAELPPEAQVVLHVSTDAPLPTGRELSLSDPIPLFDTVRFDVFENDGSMCADCTRAFALDHEGVRAGQASIGILPKSLDGGQRVRVRMYLRGVELEPEPSFDGTVDVWMALPSLTEDEVAHVTVVLPTDAVATTLGSFARPLVPLGGWPDPALVGSWPGAQRTPCSAPPAPGQACVPGGAFWMGDRALAVDQGWGDTANLRRIVVVSPFYIDTTEVTVAAFRAAGVAIERDPVLWNGVVAVQPPSNSYRSVCTYTPTPGERDALPVSCLTQPRAAAYCAAVDRMLPTEAQLEYLMGGLRGFRYPWGNDSPSCVDSIWGRWWSSSPRGVSVCREAETPPHAALPGSGASDRLMLEDVVVDISSNMAEWARDDWNRQYEPCWGPGVFHDPLCDEASPADGPGYVLRGGGWTEGWTVAAERRPAAGLHAESVAPDIGFRCVRDD